MKRLGTSAPFLRLLKRKRQNQYKPRRMAKTHQPEMMKPGSSRTTPASSLVTGSFAALARLLHHFGVSLQDQAVAVEALTQHHNALGALDQNETFDGVGLVAQLLLKVNR